MKSIQILVVEDEIIIAENIKRKLENLGYTVSAVVPSGEEAIQRAEEKHPDLVLMDIKLEGKMDGVEAAEQIRVRFDIPVVYLTAYSDRDTLQRAKITEPFGYILKPLEVRELHSVIEIALYKHKMERKLKISKENFHNIVERSADGVIVTNKEGIVHFINSIGESIFGHKAEEFIGELFGFPVIKGESVDVDILRKGRKPGIGEMRAVETEWESKPAILISIRDVTERKNMEKELKTEKAYLDQLFESAQEAIAMADNNGKIARVNSEFTRLFGYTHNEAVGQLIDDLIIPNDHFENVVSITKQVAKGNKPSCETIRQHKNGTLIHVSVLASPIIIGNKQAGTYGIYRDITERKRAEENLRQSEERAQAQYKNIPIPTYTWQKNDDEFVLVDFNNAAEVIRQRKIVNLLGRKAEEVFAGTPEILNDLARCYTEKSIVSEEVQHQLDIMSEKGSHFRFTYAYAPPNYVMLHIEDITKQKKIEKMKSEFISNVSHELRTPISIIKEGISLVLEGILGQITGDQKDILSRVKNNIDRLARLINDLLDISKIEAGKMVLKKSLVDISSLAEEVAFSFKNKAEEKKIKMKTHFNIEMPDVYIDSDRINQVLTNLISNSIKFTPENGQIALGIEDKGSGIEVYIEDTGVGISEENVPKLFDRFSQFDREDGPGEKGTGLGLPISKEIVEMHKGEIRVESEPGKGSKFIFSLPRLTQEEIFKEYLAAGVREAEEKDYTLCLIIIHINNFEDLKRKYGPSESSLIVQEIEGIIKRTLRRKSDIVSRYKEDEIIIAMLMDTPKKFVSSVKGRIKEAIDVEIGKTERLRDVLISYNEVVYPDDAKNEEELIDKIEKN